MTYCWAAYGPWVPERRSRRGPWLSLPGLCFWTGTAAEIPSDPVPRGLTCNHIHINLSARLMLLLPFKYNIHECFWKCVKVNCNVC